MIETQASRMPAPSAPLSAILPVDDVDAVATTDTTATILVCDDHEDIVDMLVAVLELEGFTPIAAHCGTEALEIVRTRHVDLVLLDKSMPDLDGFDVCRRIKRMTALHFLPVILVTAKADKADRLAGLRLGADDYITKPFDVEEILAKVRVMLRIKHIEDQLLRRNAELALFNAVVSVVGESLILEEMLHDSLAEILRLMDLPCGWIFLWDEKDTASLAVYLGPDDARAARPDIFDARLLGPSAHAAEASDACALLDEAFRARHGLRACAGIPLKAKGRVLGSMYLASQDEDRFRPDGAGFAVLQSLGRELGIATEHALLYRDTRQTVERLREIDRLKSDFISTASHEFRTPLSIIKGFANLLQRKEAFGFDAAAEKGYLGLIDGQINALTGLVEDMLDASRIESGHIAVQARPLALAPLAARIATPLALQARERGITLTIRIAEDLLVRADPGHVEQVVSNLLSNAIKYSDDDTSITVHAYPLSDGMARVDVHDQGVGIDAAHMPSLFGRFVRLENRRSIEAGGTGLGLYIARNWIEANGGRIWAESEPGRGSVFSFTLPLT